MTTPTSHPTAPAAGEVAARIAEALGWDAPVPGANKCSGDRIAIFHPATIHLVTVTMRLRLGWDEHGFTARLVYFPPDGPPHLTLRDVDILRRANNATEGMLTYGARNAGDVTLLAWLSTTAAPAGPEGDETA